MNERMNNASFPLYKCHKIVEAVKVAGISGEQPNGMFYLFPDMSHSQNKDVGKVEVTKAYIEKHKPEIGGYFVRYDNDYESYSPQKAFEGGYVLMEGLCK